jgi:hypothetical protein
MIFKNLLTILEKLPHDFGKTLDDLEKTLDLVRKSTASRGGGWRKTAAGGL